MMAHKRRVSVVSAQVEEDASCRGGTDKRNCRRGMVFDAKNSLRTLLVLATVARASGGCQITPDANGHVDMGGATSISSGAFSDCTSLVSISMPNLASVVDSTFRGCTALVSISMPSIAAKARA